MRSVLLAGWLAESWPRIRLKLQFTPSTKMKSFYSPTFPFYMPRIFYLLRIEWPDCCYTYTHPLRRHPGPLNLKFYFRIILCHWLSLSLYLYMQLDCKQKKTEFKVSRRQAGSIFEYISCWKGGARCLFVAVAAWRLKRSWLAA